jgi:Transcriptional regulator PadR-like family
MHTHHHHHHHNPPGAETMTDEAPFRGRRGRGPRFGGPGFGGQGAPGSFFGHGHRANRGDVRAAILALVAEAPMHGYQIIQEISDRSGGVWTPSPGSVYPTLQHLEEQGLLSSDEREGKKVFSLTEAGRAADPGDRAPWEEVGVDGRLIELRDGIGQVAAAVRQIARGGTPAQVLAAKTVLGDARRALYRILADDDA